MPKEKPVVQSENKPVPKGFRRISEFPPLVTFDKLEDVGKSVQGTVKRVKEISTPKSKTGKMTIAELIDDKGSLFSIALSAALLNIIPDCVGNYVLITYTGMENNPNTNQDFKKFDVLIRED